MSLLFLLVVMHLRIVMHCHNYFQRRTFVPYSPCPWCCIAWCWVSPLGEHSRHSQSWRSQYWDCRVHAYHDPHAFRCCASDHSAHGAHKDNIEECCGHRFEYLPAWANRDDPSYSLNGRILRHCWRLSVGSWIKTTVRAFETSTQRKAIVS